ncbi:uncharacterized protein LOC108605470 isoform X2 [Drosophila busckii]|uniref:uncharacterized protein LOC108605470 isoform X2 n=1 Tax=Drosophila busckii TaxID=30019 RepID=UPI00083F370C|nr:uncharacterized protein LOC108605470 isoform X2 [Drosophila busckii]
MTEPTVRMLLKGQNKERHATEAEQPPEKTPHQGSNTETFLKEQQIIELVRLEPALYDRKHSHFLDANYNKQVWQTIANQVSMKRSQCQSIWLQLLFKFKRHANRLRIYSRLDRKHEQSRPCMPHEEELLFLYTHLPPYALPEKEKSKREPEVVVVDEVAVPEIAMPATATTAAQATAVPAAAADEIIDLESEMFEHYSTNNYHQRLIEAVRAYPQLYDTRHPDYEDYRIRGISWCDIANELSDKATKLMKTWMQLLTRYEWELNHCQAVNRTQVYTQLAFMESHIRQRTHTVCKTSHYLKGNWLEPVESFRGVMTLIKALKALPDLVAQVENGWWTKPRTTVEYHNLWVSVSYKVKVSHQRCEVTWLGLRSFYQELANMRKAGYRLQDKWFFENLMAEIVDPPTGIYKVLSGGLLTGGKVIPLNEPLSKAIPAKRPKLKVVATTATATTGTSTITTATTTTALQIIKVPATTMLKAVTITPASAASLKAANSSATILKLATATTPAAAAKPGVLKLTSVSPAAATTIPILSATTIGARATIIPTTVAAQPTVLTMPRPITITPRMPLKLPAGLKLTPVPASVATQMITPPGLQVTLRPKISTLVRSTATPPPPPHNLISAPASTLKVTSVKSLAPATATITAIKTTKELPWIQARPLHALLSQPLIVAKPKAAIITSPPPLVAITKATLPVKCAKRIDLDSLTAATSTSTSTSTSNSTSSSSQSDNNKNGKKQQPSGGVMKTLSSSKHDSPTGESKTTLTGQINNHIITVTYVSKLNLKKLSVTGSFQAEMNNVRLSQFIRMVLSIPQLHNTEPDLETQRNDFWLLISKKFSIHECSCIAIWHFLLNNMQLLPKIGPLKELTNPLKGLTKVWKISHRLFGKFDEIACKYKWAKHKSVLPDFIKLMAKSEQLYADMRRSQPAAEPNAADLDVWRTAAEQFPGMNHLDVWQMFKFAFKTYMEDLERGIENPWPQNWWQALEQLRFLVNVRYVPFEPYYYIVHRKVTDEIRRCSMYEALMRPTDKAATAKAQECSTESLLAREIEEAKRLFDVEAKEQRMRRQHKLDSTDAAEQVAAASTSTSAPPSPATKKNANPTSMTAALPSPPARVTSAPPPPATTVSPAPAAKCNAASTSAPSTTNIGYTEQDLKPNKDLLDALARKCGGAAKIDIYELTRLMRCFPNCYIKSANIKQRRHAWQQVAKELNMRCSK